MAIGKTVSKLSGVTSKTSKEFLLLQCIANEGITNLSHYRKALKPELRVEFKEKIRFTGGTAKFCVAVFNVLMKVHKIDIANKMDMSSRFRKLYEKYQPEYRMMFLIGYTRIMIKTLISGSIC